ncbi:fungal hydrophobin [Armillaria solidipes]|uniref:Hydrophobin n=1 Tax=Armillaria solidipes TaxID=1076256 RepID=A0A2H3AST1_9AGAR|nr:fungal hydrophobin [Armillaria solidipes]
MFARISTFILLALPILATATTVLPRTDGGACGASGTVQCCQSTQSPSNLSPNVTSLLGFLGVAISDLVGNVGLTCSTIAVVGLISITQCDNQVVCCSNNNFNGLVALGCNPINIGL